MAKRTSLPPAVTEDGFVVREPYFDVHKEVSHYALNFRRRLTPKSLEALGSLPSMAAIEIPETSSPLDSTATLDSTSTPNLAAPAQLQLLASGQPLILPLDKSLDDDEFLQQIPIEGQLFLLRPDHSLSELVLQRCSRIRERGGRLLTAALSAITRDDEQLTKVDAVIIDFRRFGRVDRQTLCAFYSSMNCQLVAANVNSHAEYKEACDLGFHLLQGLFYLRSAAERGKLPENESTTFSLLQAVQEERLDFDRVNESLTEIFGDEELV